MPPTPDPKQPAWGTYCQAGGQTSPWHLPQNPSMGGTPGWAGGLGEKQGLPGAAEWGPSAAGRVAGEAPGWTPTLPGPWGTGKEGLGCWGARTPAHSLPHSLNSPAVS